MNLVELADQNYEKFGEVTKFIYEDQNYSNLRLTSSSNRLANALIDLGIKPGEKVLVKLMNSPEVVISYQAILRAGAIIVPVTYSLGQNELFHIIKNSKASAIITEKLFLDGVHQAGDEIDTLKHIIAIDGENSPDTIDYHPLISRYPDRAPNVDISDDSLAVILYTSGTTGVPKGVMLTHKNLYTNAHSIFDMEPDRDQNTVSLFILPLSHSFGLTMMNLGFLIPNKSVIMPRFDLETACQLIEKYKISKFAGVPSIFSMMLGCPDIIDKYDLTSLTECNSGSAPLSTETLTAFEKKFNCMIMEGYGLSEASPAVAAHYKGRERKAGSVGQALSGVIIKIVDDEGVELPDNEVGELLIYGDNISPGYHEMPDQTKATFNNGWLHTGDMAKKDEEGYLFIVNRKKELIIRGGFNIFPRDVEDVLHCHPAVNEAAVLGVPDKIMGESVLAYLTLLPGAVATEEEILEHCYEHLSKFKCPKQIKFLDVMPRNLIGKILKKDLVTLYQSQAVSGDQG